MSSIPRSKDFDYEILGGVSREVEEFLREDEASNDLAALLHHDCSAEYSTNSGMQYDNFINIPKEFLKLYDGVKSNSSMGLLPEINRAWISIDNHLYLWNYYTEDENNNEFALYDGFSARDVINSVCLAKPKKGVFNDKVRELLNL